MLYEKALHSRARVRQFRIAVREEISPRDRRAPANPSGCRELRDFMKNLRDSVQEPCSMQSLDSNASRILAEKHTPHRRPRPHLRFRYNLYRTSKSSGRTIEEAGNDGVVGAGGYSRA